MCPFHDTRPRVISTCDKWLWLFAIVKLLKLVETQFLKNQAIKADCDMICAIFAQIVGSLLETHKAQ